MLWSVRPGNSFRNHEGKVKFLIRCGKPSATPLFERAESFLKFVVPPRVRKRRRRCALPAQSKMGLEATETVVKPTASWTAVASEARHRFLNGRKASLCS